MTPEQILLQPFRDNSPSATSLDLSATSPIVPPGDFTESLIHELLFILPMSTTLTELNLSGHVMTDEITRALGQQLSQPKFPLKILNVEATSLTAGQFFIIADALRQNNALTALHFSVRTGKFTE